MWIKIKFEKQCFHSPAAPTPCPLAVNWDLNSFISEGRYQVPLNHRKVSQYTAHRGSFNKTFSIISSITLAHCFKDLEQFQNLAHSPYPDPISLTSEKQTWWGWGPHFCRVDFLVANLLGLWSEKKMFLVPETLINLLLLNPNHLTHWSRECPICFLGSSVNFSAGEDSVIRDDGREGRWKEDVQCNQICSLRGHGWGSQNLPEEALLQITADSQLWEDSGSGSPGCGWIQVLTVRAYLYWVSTSREIYPDQVPPTLVTDTYKCLLLSMCHLIQSSHQTSEDSIIRPFHRWENKSRERLCKSLKVKRLVRNWAICSPRPLCGISPATSETQHSGFCGSVPPAVFSSSVSFHLLSV